MTNRERINILKTVDSEVYEAIQQETKRQQDNIELIASENIVSEAVLAAAGSVLTNKYAEGYPAKRYYGGCQCVDIVENIARERCKQLFGCDHANVQPHSGSSANIAVYFALLKPGDTIMGMSLSDGGHLTHGSPVNFSGMYFNVVPYGVDPVTQVLDYDAMEKIALECKPKMIVSGASAYCRRLDFRRIREICDKVGAYMMVDIAHIAGLVAAGLHESPVPYADVVTTTTHKTLRGPRGGVIMCKEQYAKAIDKATFPGVQGGPLMHIIAAKAVAFGEALKPEFREYQEQILKNAKTLCAALQKNGFNIVSDGTDNHLMLVDLRGKFEGVTGRIAETQLEKAGITLNKNMVPFDSRTPFHTSGIRVGTPAITSRGFVEKDMTDIVALIDEVLTSCDRHIEALSLKKADVPTEEQKQSLAEHAAVLEQVKKKVSQMTAGVPLNKY